MTPGFATHLVLVLTLAVQGVAAQAMPRLPSMPAPVAAAEAMPCHDAAVEEVEKGCCTTSICDAVCAAAALPVASTTLATPVPAIAGPRRAERRAPQADVEPDPRPPIARG